MKASARAETRAGTVGVATLLAVPGLLLLASLVFYVSTLRNSRSESQVGADAAALAAARAWRLTIY